VRRAIAGFGRTLVTLGLLILLFVVYQLWGTGIFTARAQDRLKHKFATELHHSDNPVVGPSTTTASTRPHPITTTVYKPRPAPPTPPEGEVEGLIDIPRIGLHDMAFVEGVSLDDLRKGPGHYPATPMPGQYGNAAIAGHRTTYLHPFFRLDELGKGDKIIIKTFQGTYTYLFAEQLIVQPTDTWVLDPPKNPTVAELTLTACHPRYSAAQRIVVHALLVPNESAKPSKAKPQKPKQTLRGTSAGSLEEGLTGRRNGLSSTAGWAGLAALAGLVWWWMFRRWRHPLTWAVGVVPFLVALFPFYYHLDRAVTPFGH
jgi:sortase A